MELSARIRKEVHEEDSLEGEEFRKDPIACKGTPRPPSASRKVGGHEDAKRLVRCYYRLPAAGDEHHIVPHFCEDRSVVSPDPSRPEHRDTHVQASGWRDALVRLKTPGGASEIRFACAARGPLADSCENIRTSLSLSTPCASKGRR